MGQTALKEVIFFIFLEKFPTKSWLVKYYFGPMLLAEK